MCYLTHTLNGSFAWTAAGKWCGVSLIQERLSGGATSRQ
jgi:hypothetical protein